MSVALAWLRRELRVHDNPVLAAARASAEFVVCTFVAEPALLAVSPRRTALLSSALTSMDAELRRRGSRLVLRRGPAVTSLPALAERVGAHSVFAAGDVTPRAKERERAVAEALSAQGRRLELTEGIAIRPPGSVRRKDGGPYKLFTPYFRTWSALPPEPIAPTPRSIRSIDVPSDARPRALVASGRARPGGGVSDERSALAALRAFLARAGDYETGRHSLDGSGGSGLSHAFRFGLLSPRLAAAEAATVAGGASFVRQLAWRDFAYDTVDAHPELLARSVRSRDWTRDDAALAAWRGGRTGVDAVDAAMRELSATGFVSNRARMLVASYLTRDLGLDWRDGAAHFLRLLVDGDPAVNAVNWQWVAGSGYDAAKPWWRLAPERQAERYDPDGTWRAVWLDDAVTPPRR